MKESEDTLFFRIIEEIIPPDVSTMEKLSDNGHISPESVELAEGSMDTILKISGRNGLLLERVFNILADKERSLNPDGNTLQNTKTLYERYMRLASESSDLDYAKAECFFLSMAGTQAMYVVGHLPYPENIEFSQKILTEMFVKAEFGKKYNQLVYNSTLDSEF